MRRERQKLWTILGGAALLLGILSGRAVQPAKAAESGLRGNIILAGSSSMEKLAHAMAESFMIKYPGVTAAVEFTGSTAGVEAVVEGVVDIGISSRALKDSEKEDGAVENIVAIDGIAIVTDAGSSVDNLSVEELRGVYRGEIRNWKELGGEDQPVVVVGREAASGTRSAFEEILELQDQCSYAAELDSTGAVMAKVASTPGAIGYVSMDVWNPTVKMLKLDRIEPSRETILDGSYTLCRPFVMATKGEMGVQDEIVQEFFRFIQSEEGQEVISFVGLTPAE